MRRLMTIPGIDRKTAWMIVAEIGVDMSVYGDAPHLASWAGLCPGNRESGGKRMSGRTRKANRYVRRAMCQAAWAATHTKNTYLSAFYRRIQMRKGAPKAVLALAHHLITIVYNVLARGEQYVELGADHHDRRNKPKTVTRLVARLARLGYHVDLKPIEPDPPNESVLLERSSEGASDNNAAAGAGHDTTVALKPKRGRPCKCHERGIICKHGRAVGANSLTDQVSSA